MKKKTINKNSFVRFLLCILILYTILFPADKLNVKELLFFITLFFGYFGEKRSIPKFILFFGLIYPSITIVYSLLLGINLSNALSFGYVWYFLLLIPIINDVEFNYTKVFIIATYVVALVIDLIMLGDLLGIISIFDNPLSIFLKNSNEIQGLGKGVLATFGYYIFYKSCPLIILSYAYMVYKKAYMKSIPLLMALFVCGTRANFLIGLFITIFVPILSFNRISQKIIIVILIFSVSLIVFPSVYQKMNYISSLKYNMSEAIKIADAKISIEKVNSNALYFLFGTGVGSSFYSSRGKVMSTFELSFIDYLRQTGTFGLSIFISFLGIIIRKLIKNKGNWITISFLCYLAIAATNPLLVTSTSFMVYLFVINFINKCEKCKKEGLE